MQRLLLEAPALPQPAAASLFRELLRAGPAWVNTTLSTVLAGITARPPDRWVCLGSALSVSIYALTAVSSALHVHEHVWLPCKASSLLKNERVETPLVVLASLHAHHLTTIESYHLPERGRSQRLLTLCGIAAQDRSRGGGAERGHRCR